VSKWDIITATEEVKGESFTAPFLLQFLCKNENPKEALFIEHFKSSSWKKL